MWMTVKDLAKHLGVSVKTIRRRLAKGEWESRTVPNPNGGRDLFEIKFMMKSGPEQVDNSDESQVDTTGQLDTIEKSQADSAEQVDNFQNSQVDIIKQLDSSEDSQVDTPTQYFEVILTGQDNQTGSHPQTGAVSSTVPDLIRNADHVPDLAPDTVIPQKYFTQAQMRGKLCEEIDAILKKVKPKSKAWSSITHLFNNGMLVKPCFEQEGKKSTRSLQRWYKEYMAAGRDFQTLVPAYRSSERETSVPQQVMNDLFSLILGPNGVSIGTAITTVQVYYKTQGLPLTCSASTMRRAVDRWRKENPHIWTMAREGEKAFRDKIGKVIFRDMAMLHVGDVWIADGHRLAFDIVDPLSGKPKRFLLVVYYDWASRMPVGCDLNLTENSQVIMSAFRNGGLVCGYLPKVVYQDNGRAFRAKIFTANPEKHDLEEELAGLFYRAGSRPVWAIPYNARAKNVERFFLTVQNNFERLLPSWRGANPMQKPATLKRNEKWIAKLHQREALTIDEFKAAFSYWVYEMYGKTPHKGLKGRTPLEVFEQGNKQIDPSRRIAVSELNYLMRTIDKRKISNKGVNLFGLFFWHEELIKHVGQEAYVQYDIMNLDHGVLVYSAGKQKFICQAEQQQKIHPMYILSDDPVKSKLELEKQVSQQRRLEKQTRKGVERLLEQVTDNSHEIAIELSERGKLFSTTPLIDKPAKKQSIEEVTADQFTEHETIEFDLPEDTDDDDTTLPNLEDLGFKI